MILFFDDLDAKRPEGLTGPAPRYGLEKYSGIRMYCRMSVAGAQLRPPSTNLTASLQLAIRALQQERRAAAGLKLARSLAPCHVEREGRGRRRLLAARSMVTEPAIFFPGHATQAVPASQAREGGRASN